MSYTRFAIYYIPPNGALAAFGAKWLGWDVVAGKPYGQMNIAGLDEITMKPQKYGFHGTLKPPFHLFSGQDVHALQDKLDTFSQTHSPARCDALRLSNIGSFLALTPEGDTAELAALAAACVTEFDMFRAPPSDAELMRRRTANLSAAQEENLIRWGYPYVFDAFRFHMTLSGQIPPDEIAHWQQILSTHLPVLPAPFVIDSIALAVEREDGRFELIQRYPLTG